MSNISPDSQDVPTGTTALKIGMWDNYAHKILCQSVQGFWNTDTPNFPILRRLRAVKTLRYHTVT